MRLKIAPTSSGSLQDRIGQAPMVGRVAYEPRTSQEQAVLPNHDVTDCVADRHRDLEIMVRTALAAVARQAMQDVAPGQRSASETQFLKDIARPEGRRDFANLTRLLAITMRAPNPHLLSEAIRAEEIRTLADRCVCWTDATDRETDANHPLNQAQILAEREPTRTRLEAVRLFGMRQIAATRELIDAATAKMARLS